MSEEKKQEGPATSEIKKGGVPVVVYDPGQVEKDFEIAKKEARALLDRIKRGMPVWHPDLLWSVDESIASSIRVMKKKNLEAPFSTLMCAVDELAEKDGVEANVNARVQDSWIAYNLCRWYAGRRLYEESDWIKNWTPPESWMARFFPAGHGTDQVCYDELTKILQGRRLMKK
jgi:hypothetical protein